MNPYNYTHLVNNPACEFGLGCLFKNINDVGNTYPFLALFIIIYIISTTALVKNNNNFVKSFTSSTFLMLFLAIISIPYGMLNERLLLITISSLAILSAINVYNIRNQ